MTRETSERDVSIGQVAANFLDFLETITTDYAGFSDDLRSLLKSLQVVVGGAIALTLGFFVLYLWYVAPSSDIIVFGEVTGSAIILVIVFIYLLLRTRRSREDLDHLAYHMTELVESHTETVIKMETVDPAKPEQEQIANLLRRADFNLDEMLNEKPDLLHFGREVKGKKHVIQADVYIGVPRESRWSKLRDGALGSKLELLWMALRHEGNDPMSLSEIRSIHERLSDILPYLNPIVAEVYLFSKAGFSEEAIRFAEDEANWIPHWNEGSEEEENAVINLIKIEGDGRFSVVSMPWLKTLREERLALAAEASSAS